MDQLCQLGIVGEALGSKPREVHVRDIVELEHMLDLFYPGSCIGIRSEGLGSQ